MQYKVGLVRIFRLAIANNPGIASFIRSIYHGVIQGN